MWVKITNKSTDYHIVSNMYFLMFTYIYRHTFYFHFCTHLHTNTCNSSYDPEELKSHNEHGQI